MLSEEHKKKISEAKKGKIQSEEHRRKNSEKHIGKKPSEETKLKISKSLKGRKLSEEHKRKMSEANKGSKGSNWKGGKRNHCEGYVEIYNPHRHCNKRGYIFEHRFVMEEILGRYLTKKEVVHHINGIKFDNRPENLMLFPNSGKHIHYHALKIKRIE